MKVLDLFCGAGGAAMGLHRAWPDAEIVGVDWVNQPRYPFSFRIANALTYPLEGFDFIWASPPCQAFTALKTMWNRKNGHPELVTPIRERLLESGLPWVIENVPNAPLRKAVMLCGTMFGLGVLGANAELRRHRWFESSFPILVPSCQHRAGRRIIPVYSHGDGGPNAPIAGRKRTITVVSKQGGSTPKTSGISRRDGTQGFNVRERREAMGIDWMKDSELSQAVPPAYSEFIARQFDINFIHAS